MADDPQKPAADEDQGQQPIEEAPAAQPETPAAQPETVSNPEAQEAAREAAKYRKELRTAEKKLEQFEADAKKRQEAEMTELEKAQTRITELEGVQDTVAAYEEVLQQVLDRELESVPEDKRDSIQGDTPAARLADLSRLKALGLFAPSSTFTAPNLNATEGGAKATNEDEGLSENARQFKAIAKERGYLRRKKE